jgi:hypothetical protein
MAMGLPICELEEKNVRRLKASQFGVTRFEADIKVMVKLSL